MTTKIRKARQARVAASLGRLRRSAQAVPLAARQQLRRLLPGEAQHLFALTLVVGVVCGFAAVAFHLAIRAAEALLIERAIAQPGTRWMWWTVLTPTLGGLVAGALLTWIVPGARGSGIPQVKAAYASEVGRVRFRDAVGKFVIGALQIGSGASLGREGPTVQICAGATSLLARATGLPPRNMRRLTPVGVAAGIAAAFNAPIAAVTFTIEEIVGTLDNTVLSGVVVAAALAAVIERGVLGVHPVIEVDKSYGLEHASSLLTYALLGVAAALVSVAFSEGLLQLRLGFRKLRAIPAWAHPAVGGLVTGVGAVIMLRWLNVSGVTGGGYDTLGRALAGELGLRVLLALCAVKLIATVFSYSSGGAGGIFAPALFVGAMLGGAFGYADVALFDHGHKQLGSFALVGMGAVFAGVIRAPITSVLIIFEMTGGYGLVLPLMLANMTSYALARSLRPEPIYEALLAQDGVELPRAAERVHVLERLKVVDAMSAPARSVHEEQTLAEAQQALAGQSFAVAPLLDAQHHLLGGVALTDLRRAAAQQPDGTLRVLKKPLHTIVASEPLLSAVVRMTELGVRQLTVIADVPSAPLLGMLAISDLVRAHARAAAHGGSAAPSAPISIPPGPELRAQNLMRELCLIDQSTSLRELPQQAKAERSYVVRLAEGDRVLSAPDFAAMAREEDFEGVLRAADLARPAARVQPDSSLSELARALREADASCAIVYDAADRPLGVVTRDALADALLEWFTARVSTPRRARNAAATGKLGPRSHAPRGA